MKTKKQIRAAFWQMLQESAPSLAAMKRSKKTQNDYPADIRMSFVNYIDALAKDGIITKKMAYSITL